ncbi:MAG: metal-dependent transcriptional regulator [Kiritimatiellae bacterium]|nr:metal-dependent transcriptional regulator [Kiritimatiellia bacterium]MDW8458241.1 metal-dependent transcriptional regulator [Verrucomicrobiota bacterium]
MAVDVWKSYEENTLTHSAAHYLMTIRELLETQGYARVTDIAKRLNITRGSCSISLKPLKRRGLVVEDANKFLQLSPEGRRLAEIVERNDELLEIFFRDVLGVNPDQAEIDACKIEHLLSIETSVKLCNFIECIRSGSPAARAFLDQLRQQERACKHEVRTCPHCQETCFFEMQKIEVDSSKKSLRKSNRSFTSA